LTNRMSLRWKYAFFLFIGEGTVNHLFLRIWIRIVKLLEEKQWATIINLITNQCLCSSQTLGFGSTDEGTALWIVLKNPAISWRSCKYSFRSPCKQPICREQIVSFLL
jgi:hypothetical protein